MTTVHLESVGLIAPGLGSWASARAVLAGKQPHVAGEAVTAQPALLPANERRRAPFSVLVALHAAEEAVNASTIPAAHLPSVFASSDGEMAIMHRLCSALATPARAVSPTDFHNSVHNAAAGYWGIAAHAPASATTIAAFDHSVAAGLREAFALLAGDAPAMLLVAYDVPPPVPLYEKRPIETACAVACVLTRSATSRSFATLSLAAAREESMLAAPSLELLRLANPAARALPLLESLALRRSGVIGLRAEDDALLGIDVRCR